MRLEKSFCKAIKKQNMNFSALPGKSLFKERKA